MGAVARSDPTDLVIEVLEGPRAGQKIALTGRELPYRAGGGGSVSFGVELRVKTTWYAGNPVASQQVIGRKLLPTTFNGVWKEHFIGIDRPIGLAELMEELVSTGVQLLVSWSTIIRTGVARTFTYKPGVPTGGLGDLGWDLVFEWNGDGVPAPQALEFASPFDIGTFASNLVGAATTLSDTLEALVDVATPGPMFEAEIPVATADAVEAQEAVQRAADATVKGALLAEIDRTVSALVIAEGEAAAAAAKSAADTVAALSIGAIVDSDDADRVVLARLSVVDILEAAVALATDAIELRDQTEAVARPSVALRIPAVAGTDLRTYAARYYGDPDLWSRLARANGLTDSRVPEGLTELLIPDRLDGLASDARSSAR